MKTPRETLIAPGAPAAGVTLASAVAYVQTRPLPSAPATDAYKATAPEKASAAPAKPAPNVKARGSGEEEEIQPRSRQDVQRPDKSDGKPLMPSGLLTAKPGAKTVPPAGRALPPGPKEAIK